MEDIEKLKHLVNTLELLDDANIGERFYLQNMKVLLKVDNCIKEKNKLTDKQKQDIITIGKNFCSVLDEILNKEGGVL